MILCFSGSRIKTFLPTDVHKKKDIGDNPMRTMAVNSINCCQPPKNMRNISFGYASGTSLDLTQLTKDTFQGNCGSCKKESNIMPVVPAQDYLRLQEKFNLALRALAEINVAKQKSKA